MISCSNETEKPETFTVTVVKEDGMELGSEEIEKGEKYTLPETFSSIGEGYRLVSCSDGKNTCNPKDEISVDSDIKLTAAISQEFTVTFMNGCSEEEKVKVLYGETVPSFSFPDIITLDGSNEVFRDWKVQGTGADFNSSTPVTSSITVEAVIEQDTSRDDD